MGKKARRGARRRRWAWGRSLMLVFGALGAIAALAATLLLYVHLNRERMFWEWFADYEMTAFEYERDQERVFDEIQRKLHAVDRTLMFLIGPKEDGRREFIISADGRIAAFPAVMSLHDKAPAFERWIILAFRPRTKGVFSIELGGHNVRSDEIQFTARALGTRYNVDLFMPERLLDNQRAARTIATLMLDGVVGEHDLATRIGQIGLHPAADGERVSARPLAELAGLIDQIKSASASQ